SSVRPSSARSPSSSAWGERSLASASSCAPPPPWPGGSRGPSCGRPIGGPSFRDDPDKGGGAMEATPPSGPVLEEVGVRLSHLWWLWLISGVLWVVIALVILQFDQASIT